MYALNEMNTFLLRAFCENVFLIPDKQVFKKNQQVLVDDGDNIEVNQSQLNKKKDV